MKYFLLKKQQGISLVELLIAMALGLVLLTGLISFYVSSKKTYHLAQSLARLQEDGRIAMQVLSRDIRMAGYVGCGHLSNIEINKKLLVDNDGLVGWHDSQSSSELMLPELKRKPRSQSDVLQIQFADPNRVAVKATTKSSLNFSRRHDFAKEDILLISDCHDADVFLLGNPTFHKIYQNDAQVSRWQKIIYFVAKTDRKNSLGKSVYALYRRDLNGKASHSELIDNVENMQIYYGELTSSGLEYVDAIHVKDWNAVRSVKIDLLLVSQDMVNERPQSYVFAGKKYQADDRRLYQSWQTVVALRERQ